MKVRSVLIQVAILALLTFAAVSALARPVPAGQNGGASCTSLSCPMPLGS